MSGLLEKDICLLLRGHRNMLILFFMICVFLGLGQPGTFILGYLPSLMLVVLIRTFSCDESDNGFPFLFTLPIDRKTYIQEKYVFCVGGTVVSFAIAWVLYMASQVLHGVSNLSGLLLENAGTIPVFLAVFFIALSVMIPVQIKFGAESARVLMAGICFFFAGVVLFVQKIAGEATLVRSRSCLAPSRETFLDRREFLRISIAVVLISYGISVRFMEKREI